MISITGFDKNDQKEVKDFVLHIQNDEFLLGFTDKEQTDLMDTAGFYANGGFWTAKMHHEIIGTIGLQKLDSSNAILRKMFVKKECRGKILNVAQQLLNTLMAFAKEKGIKNIWLDTPAVATASHKFYERNGFVQTDKLSLPKNYVFPDKNSKIYKLSFE
jgi:N-acetylglutamate synthase-like GNAT family acetyltransferase